MLSFQFPYKQWEKMLCFIFKANQTLLIDHVVFTYSSDI